ncbi:hypothetical protein [Variovorax rhizosphaerae]|uniref:Fascin-like domain-containing protein n=1 Tax=Variovorax rhizosphaerae TaxID=1836200 RepID=A0ABU8WPW3_9BURK
MQKVIAFRTQSGHYLCAENAGAAALVANRPAVGPWEIFLVVDHEGGSVALQACNGNYIGLATSGLLVARADEIGTAESWRRVPQGPRRVALRHANGRYLSAVGGGGAGVGLTATSVGTNEVFEEVAVQGSASGFSPEIHGFRFTNTFEVEPIQNVRFSGLCGGMAYAALDYYNARVQIPPQDYRPAVGTPLFNFIFSRQGRSIVDNLDKWGELFFNPFGWRSDEFFRWGLQGYAGGRLQELRTALSLGHPTPLGLFKAGNGGAGPHHQVLAIGVSQGRYLGDLGNNAEDLRIFIYDPNFPNKVMTLAPSLADKCYYYLENPSCRWMTYFVDRKYRPVVPPTLPATPTTVDGVVDELLLEIRTGGDDLRGGNDNVHATIGYADGSVQVAPNINHLARWIDHHTETVPIALSRRVRPAELKSVTLTTTFGGGIAGDNWNLDALRVLAGGAELYSQRGTPLRRFTGDNRPFVAELMVR